MPLDPVERSDGSDVRTVGEERSSEPPVVIPDAERRMVPQLTASPDEAPNRHHAGGEGTEGPQLEVENGSSASEVPVEGQGEGEGLGEPSQPVMERPEHVADPARRRRMMPWAIAGCVLVVLGTTAIGLSYTPLVAAKTVTVRGDRHFTDAQVLHIARLGEGANLIHADLAGAQRRLERNPWILDASIERDLPHTLRISVVERTPVAVTARPNGAFVYVATDGTTLGPAAAASTLPSVVAVDGEIPASAEVLRVGASVAAAMPIGLQQRADTISVSPDGSIVVETLRHVVATYGDDSQLEAKGQTLKAVLDWSEREGVPLAAVDVTVPGAPTARRYGAPAGSQISLGSRLT